MSGGPKAILGTAPALGAATVPLVASRSSLFGPRGATLVPGGPLVVSDTGHHRVMIWTRLPEVDQQPGDLLIGQTDFGREGRNGKRDPDASSLNVPTGVAANPDLLAVADAWNHRVLLWHGLPTRSNQPADVVLGQEDFSEVRANRGSSEAAANTLNWCYGVAILDGNLAVCDTGNRRVLLWDGIPEVNGAPADLVVGQRDLATRDENAGTDAGPLGMRWPHAVTLHHDRLLVADAGDNRVLIWDRVPTEAGVPADLALGQRDFSAVEHNRANYLPSASALNMPYGVAANKELVVVADTANSRLLAWRSNEISFGAPASALAAQPDFGSKGDNQWGPSEATSLCWPYGISLSDDTAVIADSGNNRVVLWDLAMDGAG